jgi:seryl-tRNA synthetase
VIDLARLRDDVKYRQGIERKRVAEGLLDEVVAANETRRGLLTEVEGLRAEQNAASKAIGKAVPDERDQKIAAAGALKERVSALEPELAAAEAKLRELALQVPNPADASVPDGGEDDGEVLRTVGDAGPAPAHDHAEFAEAMGFVITDAAAELSGSRFAYLAREAVMVELALVRFAMELVSAEGFIPTVTPVLVREHAMEEAGFFPIDRAQVYEVDGGELFLVGTSEIALAGLHRDEILATAALPLRYAGYSSCFRREAGTYGKDTRGIFRVHQFDKVEMFSYCHPDESWNELDAVLALQESIVTSLGIPYQVVNIAAGDLGAPAAKKYDIEAWLPSEGRYRELTSCSNYLEYSARRLATRLRGDDANRLVHTVNGTACAIGRTLVFLFEHGQQADGSWKIPEALVPYTGFDTVPAR